MKAFHGGRAVAIVRTAFFGVLSFANLNATIAASAQTNLAVTVRHAPSLNAGRIEGSLQQLLGESCVINGGAVLTGDWLVPGTPKVKLNGSPVFAGVIPGTGATKPSGYTLTLNGGVTLRHVRTRTDPVSLPFVATPPGPSGTRSVTVNVPGQSIGNFATLRNLTLNGNVGLVSVPPGTYGHLTANAGSGFVLGSVGSSSPAVYSLQSLTLNGVTDVRVVGPVIVTVACGVTLNGRVGATNHPAWLQLRSASGGVTLNGGCSLGALVAAPSGTVTINGNSVLVGTAACDRFILNAGGLVRWASAGNQAPVAQSQDVTTREDTVAAIALSGSDPDGDAVAFSIVSPPAHGQLTGTAPNLVYSPDPNFTGSDSFSFQVNDSQADSPSATVNVTVTPVNDAPSFVVGAGQQVLEDAGPQTIAGWAASIIAGPADEASQQAGFLVTNDNPLLFDVQPSVSATGTLTYTPAANAFGTATVTTRLHDDGGVANGGIDVSATQNFTITIKPVNDPPSVAILAPATGGFFDEGTPVSVSVDASDSDGAIDRIVVLADGSAIGELRSTPFQLSWDGGAMGTRLLTAVAYDNEGAAATSGPVTMSILAAERGSILVDAGSDQVIGLPGGAALAGTLTIPEPEAGAATNMVWSKVSGPGAVGFSSPGTMITAAEFGAPGTYVLRLAVRYSDSSRSDTVTVAVLPEPDDRITATRSNRGTDFWLTFLENYQPYSEPRRYGLNLVITSETDTSGEVLILDEGLSTTRRFSVRAGAPAVVPITDYGGGQGLRESDVIRTNGIHVTAEDEISVYALNYLDQTTDGYTALPTSLLGADYLALAYKNTEAAWEEPTEQGDFRVIGGTQFAVVATENDTVVTITPSTDSGLRTRGVPFNISLNRGETYRLIEETTAEADFTGTLIAATRPVAVFSGHKCANLPDGFQACDHLVEQLPPVTTWGRRFVTMPLATRQHGDTFRILAARDSTMIAVNGVLAGRLDRGQFLERVLAAPAEILASEPVLIVQLANSSEFDDTTGDPFMLLIPPVEQFGGDYTFATPRLFDSWQHSYTNIFDDFLNLAVRMGDAEAITLDGAPIDPGVWVPIGNSGYSGAQISVTPGVHRVTAPLPFGACVYGWADFESYAYVGGIYSETVEAGTQLILSQVTPNAAIGLEKVVVARVTDGRGRPLPDLGVTFSVSGGHSLQATLKTSRFGEATFSYAGTQSGADLIHASLGGVERAVTNIWLTTAFNQTPVVSAGENMLVNFGTTVSLGGSMTDDGQPVGGGLTAIWRTVSGPVEVRFTQPMQPDTTASFDLPGIYRLELTASDTQFAQRSFVTVTVNALPSAELAVDPSSGVAEVGETLRFTAYASDVDGTIARVELFDGDTKVAESIVAADGNRYSFEWIVPDSLVHQFSSAAVDDRGASVRSVPVPVRGNLPPSVVFLGPAEGLVLNALSPVDLTVDAIDPDGVVTAVYYFANGEYLGVGSGPDFRLSWTPPSFAGYLLLAVAEDNDGWFGTSVERRMEVRAPAPTVVLSMTLPDPDRGSLVGFPLVLSADARVAAPFRIDRVDFLLGDQLVGQATNWPFQILHAPTNPGALSFVARAYADSGNWADSAPVSVQPVPWMEVRWDAVSDGEWMPLGAPKRLMIQTDDPGHSFDHATFYVDGAVLEETVFGYADWTPATPGEHVVQAVVTDAFGNTYPTSALTLRAAELSPPQVRILSPANLSRFAPGTPVPMLVEAVDGDGIVTNLTLTRFSTPDVSSDTGSLSFVWTNLPPGEHTFTSMAVDDTGQTSETSVRILVELPLTASLQPPGNLAAEALGCNAVRVRWTLPPGTPADTIVVVERSTETDDVWTPVAFVPADQTEIRDAFLQPSATYRYRAYSKNPHEERSANSGVAEARTRLYLPRFAALDLAEGLVDGGVLNLAMTDEPIDDDDNDGGWQRARLDVRRVANEFLPVTPEYLNGLIPLGLSDNHRVLMINEISGTDRRTFLWRPDGNHQQFDRESFEPYRLARPGVPVGTLLHVVQDEEGHDVPQYHAGLWVDGFLDFTPDVAALTSPPDHVTVRNPYVTDNLLTDVNVSGVSVGRATWAYFESDEPDSRLLLPPVVKATVWTGLGQPGITFGALNLLNNESEFLAINDAGDIVGVSRIYDPLRPDVRVTHAVRSRLSLATATGNKLTDLGTLGGLFSAARSINRSGWAVGYSTVHPDDSIDRTRAVFWRPDEVFPRQLPGFGDDLKTYGWAINDNYWIVGDAVRTNDLQHAALWTPSVLTNRSAGFDLSDLNERVSSSDWQLATAQFVNQAGFISGFGWHAATVIVDDVPEFQAPVPRAYLLAPNVSLEVDYNRDGRIEMNEKDDLPKDTSYQFWVNDDTDSGDEAGFNSDIPGARVGVLEIDGRRPNHSDELVNGTCDLPDWFPVYLNITNLLALFPPESNAYLLRHPEGALNFVYTDLLPEQAGSYLTNRLSTGFGWSFDRPPGSADCRQVTAGGTVLNPFFLEKIRSEGRGVLLFEARQATDQPLRLEVWNNRRMVTGIELPLQISGVEDLYGWVNLRGLTGQTPERLSSYQHPANLPVFSKEDRHAVFVHGYNVNEHQSRGWSAEMFKRLWWSGSNARYYGVSWHGDESQFLGVSFNYQVNLINAFRTAPVLASFVNGLARQGDVTLIGHSMGNVVAGVAIQDEGARPDRYFMMDAAVAIEAYVADAESEPHMTNPKWKDYEPRLFASEWHQLFPADDGRRSLTWRGRFGGVVKSTTVYNFYSSGEEVLANMNVQVGNVLAGLIRGGIDLLFGVTGSHAWAMQETLKGTGQTGYFLSSTYGGWGFNPGWGTVVEGENSAPPIHIPLRPDEAAALPDSVLRATPFFSPGPAGLYLPTGGLYAMDNQTQLLAEMFPARTFAAGRNPLATSSALGSTNIARGFNMNTEFKNGWPPSRLTSTKRENWLHSDLRDVAYLFSHGLYRRWVELGAMK